MMQMNLAATIKTGMAAAALGAVLLGETSLPAVAASPSFSCTGNLQPAEAVICSDDTLAALDRALSDLYENVYNSSSGARRDALEAQEKAWLAERNSCRTNKSCISNAYKVRISQLGG